MDAGPADSLLFDDLPRRPDFSAEMRLIASGVWPVAGVDEAGRGPLAGPVVAAAVILDPQALPDGLDDSKKLPAKRRAVLFDIILSCAHVSIASASAASIDGTDIRKASLDAMRRAVTGLPVAPIAALIDGRDIPEGLGCRGEALVAGDARSLSIAAASIVAKVTRDRIMARSATSYPMFGFEAHAGYATAAHRAAIALHGPCPLHRRSFRPCKEIS